MTNGGKNVKIGHDKRPVSIVPNSEQNIYSFATGQVLVDEYGNPLITEVDTFNLLDQSAQRSTSIVFPSKEDTYKRLKYKTIVGVATGGWNSSNLLTLNSGNAGITTGDKVSGLGIPDGTIVSRKISNTQFRLSNNLEGNISNRGLKIERREYTTNKSKPVFKIAEQFKEASEVSSTLLGVNRAELQLSLFSDVSSYGLDNDEFVFYNFATGSSFSSWDERINKIYGKRYNGKLSEETSESAIKLGFFPVPYSFPFGPQWEQLGLYNPELYAQYRNFINLGNDLHDHFAGSGGNGYSEEWKSQFLNRGLVNVVDSKVDYKSEYINSFAAIDTWTETWRDILLGSITDPVTTKTFNFAAVQKLSDDFASNYPVASEIRPGYSNTRDSYNILESRRVFRYQPGRISGFTFGVRASTESVSGYNIEWGVSNPTDQYIFKIKQGNLYIVRRSTVPLDASALKRSGLNLTDQTYEGTGDGYDTDPSTGERMKYYTIEVPQDNFNGDPLNGNGPSGYGIIAKNVTMWKIEFGWYGAIGCRFYAYIPVKNGDARWVVVHTFIIENSLGQPCLQDSYFRLKYVLHSYNTADLRDPHYIYKYGSSYYIDGGDRGTISINSISSDLKTVRSTNEETLVGITCKDIMVNGAGQEIKNKRSIFPIEANITSDELVEIKVQRCVGCPGFGHVLTPGVSTGLNGKLINVKFTAVDKLVGVHTETDAEHIFFRSDEGSKLIAPTTWNAYIGRVSSPESGGFAVAEITGKTGIDGPMGSRTLADGTLKADSVLGINTSIQFDTDGDIEYPHQVRLSNMNDAVVSSNLELTGSKIEIQFVNPANGDDFSHFADFQIGVTDAQPDIDEATPTELDGFIVSGVSTTILPEANMLFDTHTHRYTSLNEDGIESGEAHGGQNPSKNMEIDSRISRLGSPSPGLCSRVIIEVQNSANVSGLNLEEGNPEVEGDTSGHYLVKAGTFPSGVSFSGGEVVLNITGIVETSARYESDPKQFQDGDTLKSYVKISENISGDAGGLTEGIVIAIRPMKLTSSSKTITKLYNYNPYPLFFVAKLSDRAAINNISIKETIGNHTRTFCPEFAVYDTVTVTDADGQAEKDGSPPSNFEEIDRLTSAIVDTQNTQRLRPSELKDVFYVGENQTTLVNLTKVFGPDRTVIIPTNQNVEATFFTAKRISGSGTGMVQMSLNFGEQ